MPNGRSINRFFSPRVQGQYIPQFVEEPFPFESAFLVGAGQQKRLDDLMTQATELGQVPTRPIEEDILQRNQIVGGLQTEIEEILAQKGGELGQAARDISRSIAKTLQKPFWARNAAAIEKAERGQATWDKIAGRGETPLGIDMSAMKTPLQNPATGEWNPIGADIRQKTDWAQEFDDLYGDFKAKKVPGDIKRAPGLPGMVTKEKKVVLTEEDVEKEATKSAKAFLKTPAADEFIMEMTHLGVSPGEMEEVAANIMTAQWADKIQDDTEVELRGTLKDEGVVVAVDTETGIGAGRDIIVTSGEDQKEYTLASEHEFSLRDPKTGDPYELLVQPTYMYSLTDFSLAETETGELNFELDKIIDLKGVDKNFPELDIKKSQPFPEEGMAGFYEPEEIPTTKEVERGWLGKILHKEDIRTVPGEPETVPADVSRIKPENIRREWYASGIIKTKEKDTDVNSTTYGKMITTEKSVLIPYRFVSKSIEASTGFKADDALLEEVLVLPNGTGSFSTKELKDAGWKDADIQRLRDLQ